MRFFVLLVTLIAMHGAHAAKPSTGRQAIWRAAPRDSTQPRLAALELARQAVECAEAAGMPKARRLALIDYSLSANLRRLWVLDVASGATLFHERVAHGQGSGDAFALHFSNQAESHTSSLGLFRTLDAYEGGNGYSLRLEGLEPGVNDKAFTRQIVMHGADYVSDEFIRLSGRLGRSFGCPAVRRAIAKPLIDSLRDDQYLFAYYPDAEWLRTSPYLRCTTRGVLMQVANPD